MYKIVTLSDHYLWSKINIILIRFWLWAHKPFVKWVPEPTVSKAYNALVEGSILGPNRGSHSSKGPAQGLILTLGIDWIKSIVGFWWHYGSCAVTGSSNGIRPNGGIHSSKGPAQGLILTLRVDRIKPIVGFWSNHGSCAVIGLGSAIMPIRQYQCWLIITETYLLSLQHLKGIQMI